MSTGRLIAALVGLVVFGAASTLALASGVRHYDESFPSEVRHLPPGGGVTTATTVASPSPSPTPFPTPSTTPTPAAPARAIRHRREITRRLGSGVSPSARPAGGNAFFPAYSAAQATFRVSWLLLASIHQEETGFSSHAGTYRGLNFAGCCAGPMQFNVTNGPLTTWERYRFAYRLAPRPVSYGHRTARHPSVYDDFDSIMAAALLLRGGGATLDLDGGAWRAAYDYYGHDAFGTRYASRVVARAIGWAHNGFCPTCGTDQALIAAVDRAYAHRSARAGR